MGLGDYLRKGLKIVNDSKNSVVNSVKEKNESAKRFNQLKETSKKIEGFQAYVQQNIDVQDGKKKIILNKCINISDPDAVVINKLIPVYESIVNVKNIREEATAVNYFLVVTDRQVYLLNRNVYKCVGYDVFKKCEIIGKGMLCCYVNINDNAYTIDGDIEGVEVLFNTLMNEVFRLEEIKKSLEYIQGIKPVFQLFNSNFAGITLGYNNEIIVHTGNNINKYININNLQKIELLFDNNVVLVRGEHQKPVLTNQGKSARSISLKLLFNNETLDVNILPESMIGHIYNPEDQVFIDNYEFSLKIVNKICNLRGWVI